MVITLTTTSDVTASSSTTAGSKALNGDTTGYSTFLSNTAAVASTFVVVALVVIGVLLGIGYLVFRRRKASNLRQAEREAAGGAGDAGAGENRFGSGEIDDDNPFEGSRGSHHDSVYFQRSMTSYNTSPVYFANGGGPSRRSISSHLSHGSNVYTNSVSPRLNRPLSQDLEEVFTNLSHNTSSMEADGIEAINGSSGVYSENFQGYGKFSL